MFTRFFFTLREVGVPVSPTAFLLFHRAMAQGLVSSLTDLYIAARTTLVKSERHFDLYDQVFAHNFQGAELAAESPEEFDLLLSGMVQQWLQNPQELAAAMGLSEEELATMTPEEVIAYFKERLLDQQGRHDGGTKWIGTGGTSPVGTGGHFPGGLRIGGGSRNRSAINVAGERRYRRYATDAPMTKNSIGEALQRLKNLVPRGPKDRLNIDETIYRTMKNGGEIELAFDRAIVNRLKVVLAIDNGGWSMEPHVELVQTLFSYARTQFKDLQTYYFHNTIYDLLWQDAGRVKKPVAVSSFSRLDPNTRLIIVGDASMAPYELMSTDGSIYAFERSGMASIERLRYLAGMFRHAVWLNPVPREHWRYTRTITAIAEIFSMFELSLDGLEKAVAQLLQR